MYFHVVGMEEMAESCVALMVRATLAKDLTELELRGKSCYFRSGSTIQGAETYPPAQVQSVCHAMVVPDRLSTPEHWLPEVALLSPQRS